MVALILAILLALPRPIPSGFYDRQATVVEFDDAADIVTVEGSDGFVWEFYGVGSYVRGDTVVLLMWDNGTETVFDDVVVNAHLTRARRHLAETTRQPAGAGRGKSPQ